MRIGIDASCLVEPALTGIEYSLLQLVRRLGAVEPRHEYALFFCFRRPEYAERLAARVGPALSERVRAHVCHMPGRLMAKIRPWYPLERTLGRCDVIHHPNFYVRAQRGGARVLTVHDLIPLTHPQHCNPDLVALWERELPRALRGLDAIVAVSEHTRSELIERLGVPAERIHVVHHGVDPSFRPAPRQAVEQLRQHFGLRRPYLFALGHSEPRKNNLRLLEALARCRARGLPELELVIAGKPGPATAALQERIARLGLGAAVHRLDYVPSGALAPLYSGSAALVMPSLTEGFGMPALEAMACGAPVLAARAGSLPEVAGNAALYFEPTEVEQIADAIERVLGDTALAAGLVERGYKRVADFSWERAARETVAVYEALA